MDNTQSTMPVQPVVPQPVPQPTPEAPQPTSGGSNTALFVVGALFFLTLLGGMGYYVMQPQNTPSEDTTAQAQITPSPTPTAVAQTAEEQDVEAAVSYSLDDSFAELEKDLQEL